MTPETGQYRLSATAPGVELNELRKTLGIKPLPYPIAGAARGVMHCTGLLEEPIFSGVGSFGIPPALLLGKRDHSELLAHAGIYVYDA